MTSPICGMIKLISLPYFTAFLGLVLLTPAYAQNVRLTEIMYHAVGTNVLEEWFELHNPGSKAVSLSGWRVSKGVSFTFTTTMTLNAGEFLVVAADGPTFRAQHPAIANYVAGWTGTLSHDGEEIVLEDALGNAVDSVSYAPEGDWAVRGIGAPDAFKRQGWEWFAEHHGGGKSLELINGDLPNSHGQNWGSSSVPGGTPGLPNSIAAANSAPLILDVAHFPIVPQSNDPVTVTARLLDERAKGLSGILHWRTNGEPTFTQWAMLDDGAHNDGLAGDGVFGCVLPVAADGSIIEFYLTARDQENHLRTYPNWIPSGNARTANLVYQVDDSVYDGRQAVFRLIMAKAEYDYLSMSIWGAEPRSDAEVSGTFVSTDGVLDAGARTQFRYSAGFRNRGHGTRTSRPHNVRVNLPKDSLWKGRAGIALNTQYPHSQHLGSAVFRRLGVPMADSHPVQVRVNGANLAKPGQEQFGSYAANELVDSAMVERQFPLDGDGNHYRGIRDVVSGNPKADLAWHGDSYTSYTNAYFKNNNKSRDDWSDLVRLLDVLNNTPDDTYAPAVSNVVNVVEWMKYFAANTLLANQETSLSTGYGDDYAIYRGLRDPRFLLLPYDMDSVMGQGTTAASPRDGLFQMLAEGTSHAIPTLNRFMKHPDFAPLYYRELKRMADSQFSSAEMNPLLDQLLKSYVDAKSVDTMKAFNSNRVAYVRSQIPLTLAIAQDLSVVSGYPRTTSPAITLRGTGDAVQTRSIEVNGAAAAWTAWKGVWTNTIATLYPGLNRVLVRALGVGNAEVGRTDIDIWYDDGTVAATGGVIAADTTWTAAEGPYNVLSSLTINSGTTLTIQPGTSVYVGSGADVIVANGGRLLAEGTVSAPIHFTRAPGTTGTWGGLIVHGGAGSPETRLGYAHFDFNGSTAIHSTGGTVFLDHLTFGNTTRQYVSVDGSSFVVQDCVFPSATSQFELVHGTGGIKVGGHGVIQRCLFGLPIGYNDVVDFTGGNRPGPIIHFLHNVFLGGSDDALDLDGTDAWVEGNIFMHVHKNGSPDSASGVSGGNDSRSTSAITILGNIFYDCDQAATAKQGNFYTLIGNTIIHQTRVGGTDTEGAVVNFADEGTSEAAGMYLEGNVIYDAEKLTRLLVNASVTFTNNLMPFSWTGPGGGNSMADPRLKYIPQLAETYFTTFDEAQVMRDWFSLLPGSPAHMAGPNHRDMGGVVPIGASVSGEPAGTNSLNTATITVGVARAVDGIRTSGWPSGSGFTHYRHRLDGGTWNPEQTLGTPILLVGLADGTHRVEVSGKRDSGLYQDDPVFGSSAVVTESRTWVVDARYVPPSRQNIRLNEVLARNSSTPNSSGAPLDLIEIHNFGSTTADLSGMGLTESAANRYKFVFPANSTLAPGGFLVLFADSSPTLPGMHTGFSLKQSGDVLYLYDNPANGGALLDSVTFGPQLADFSIGRAPDGVWTLCRPTFGSANFVEACGNGRNLRLNEWLADAEFVADNDFIELYNPGPHPVDLGGWFLSDAAGSPTRNRITPLSFIEGRGFQLFIADNNPSKGATHLNFTLMPEVGLLILSAPDLTTVDVINYDSQRTDVSEGRSPNGSDTLATFDLPTPGAANPGASAGDCTIETVTVPLLALGATWRYNQKDNLDGVLWHTTGYNDEAWPSGQALLAVEDCNCLPAPGIGHTLTLGRSTYYFRTRFVVSTNLAEFRLNITAVIDDGAVLYLNGTRLLTLGMNNGTPAYATLASRNNGNAGLEFFILPTTALVHGTNVLAVEVHQTSVNSSDIVLGIALEATRTSTNCMPGSAVAVAVNEVLAGGATPPGNSDAVSHWIELYNPSTNVVDLSGLSLTDDPSFATKFVFFAGSTIQAGGYQAVFCNPGEPVSATNTGFGLNASGGALFLFNRPASGSGLIDGLRYGLQTSGYSAGRSPNGHGTWKLTLPTPGMPNAVADMGSVSLLHINEWMADPASGNDWFEVSNSDSKPVALGGLFLTDDLANKTQSRIAPLSFIGVAGNAFIQFIADGIPAAGANHVAFALKQSGEQLGIFSPAGAMLDGLGFVGQTTGVSQGRLPDNSATLVSFGKTPSPGRSNSITLDDGDGMADIWELANFGTIDRDGNGDFDGDGASDLQEYLSGTHPADPASYIRIDSAGVNAGLCTLGFTAVAGKSYTVQYRDNATDGSWQTLTVLQPAAVTGPVQVTDPPTFGNTKRFYRLVTPAIP